MINSGIIILNKPFGHTSHEITSFVKKLTGASKSGHAGTLDPDVSGVLPIALGKDTKMLRFIAGKDKIYVGILKFKEEISESKVKELFKQFIGEIEQTPPKISAVKKVKRKRKVFYLKFLEKKGKKILFEAKVSAGTYIRTLCLHPSTEVITKNGLVKMENFYSNPQEVFSFDKHKIVEVFPSKTQKILSPKNLIKITMQSGIDFVVTDDHKMFVSKKDGYAKMIESRRLREGDFLLKYSKVPYVSKKYCVCDLLDDFFYIQQDEIKKMCKHAFIKKYGSIRAMNKEFGLDRKVFLSRSKNAITIRHLKLASIYEKIKSKIFRFKTEKGKIIEINDLTSDHFYLLGLIASDGNNTKEKNTIRPTRLTFYNSNRTLVDIFIRKYKKLFPAIKISKKKEKNVWRVTTSNSLFASIAYTLGIKSPSISSDLLPILYSDPNKLKLFLKGYFDGDGGAHFKKKANVAGHHSYIRFYTSNKINAKRLHHMLLKLGITNKIFGKSGYHIVDIGCLTSKKKFINEIGTNHPKKHKLFKKILLLRSNNSIDKTYVPFSYKKYIRNNLSKLYALGGNLYRTISTNIPMSRYFYMRAQKFVKLPPINNLSVEKIIKIQKIKENTCVYDMTIPKTHNFLIETGYISSNCHDMGKRAGILARMDELRRVAVGSIKENQSATIQELIDAVWLSENKNDFSLLNKIIKPMEKFINFKKITIKNSAAEALKTGAQLMAPGIAGIEENIEKNEFVMFYSEKDEFIGIGKSLYGSEEIKKMKKGLIAKTERIY